jgi:hypothetical protein
LDVEVAVDPEMLGKIFEDNKKIAAIAAVAMIARPPTPKPDGG